MGTASGDETLLWEPSEELKQQATLTRYMQWLEREKGLYVRDQEELWHWSVSHLEDFWASIWDFFSVKASRPYTSVLADRLTSTVAPLRAWKELGGIGTHRSSQISTPTISPSTLLSSSSCGH